MFFMQPNVVFEEVIQIIKQYVAIFNEDINQINTQIAENNKGIYIYFGDLNARSCIRIYPSGSNNKYKYACGHTLVELDWEACLSLPDLMGSVPRYIKIRYSWTDLNGSRLERVAGGFHARAVQHECDHLDGILYPMRMNDFSMLGYADEVNRNHELISAGAVQNRDSGDEA